MKLGVLSDTHWQSPDQFDRRLFKVFHDVDAILHAGDMVHGAVLSLLEGFRPTYAVTGNCDEWDLHGRVPEKRLIEIRGFRIGLIHGWRRDLHYLSELGREFDGVHVVVFGHSHCAVEENRGGVLYFNPGSATCPRDGGGPTVGIIEIAGMLETYHVPL
ncbi:MAG: metallophosphoesterase family protein [Candidatus Eremiobacteraeota bacterium]|nr:metallophosphoesterase family protein [Candidatus Eremiobacteraeota bacterium]